MALVANGPTTINKGVKATLFEASGAQLPGIFAGKIRPQSLLNAADTVLVEFSQKTTPNAGYDLEVSKVMKATDLHFFLTPLESLTGYKIEVTLENTSVSASAPLDFEITRRAV